MLYALSVIGICIVMICLPFCQSFNTVLAACIFYGIFAGGIPGNGPMVYSESFKEDLPSAMGIASIGRALSALSMGPLASMSFLNFVHAIMILNQLFFFFRYC